MRTRIVNITSVDINYRRPGTTLLKFTAEYPSYSRRGTIVFDIVRDVFVTHTSDIELLSKVCVYIQKPKVRAMKKYE